MIPSPYIRQRLIDFSLGDVQEIALLCREVNFIALKTLALQKSRKTMTPENRGQMNGVVKIIGGSVWVACFEHIS